MDKASTMQQLCFLVLKATQRTQQEYRNCMYLMFAEEVDGARQRGRAPSDYRYVSKHLVELRFQPQHYVTSNSTLLLT